MNDVLLDSRLNRVARRFRWIRVLRLVSVCWAGAALVGCCVFAWQAGATGWAPAAARWVLLIGAVLAAILLAVWQGRRGPDLRWVAGKLKPAYPELEGALLTAIQPNPDTAEFLRQRVIRSAIQHQPGRGLARGGAGGTARCDVRAAGAGARRTHLRGGIVAGGACRR
jgi:hypothetical protein